MSTKTIYKRIALVAVATLGAGLLSAAPASANFTALTFTSAVTNAVNDGTAGAPIPSGTALTANLTIATTTESVAGNTASPIYTVTAGPAALNITSTCTFVASTAIAADFTVTLTNAATGAFSAVAVGAEPAATYIIGTVSCPTTIGGTYTITPTGNGVGAGAITSTKTAVSAIVSGLNVSQGTTRSTTAGTAQNGGNANVIFTLPTRAAATDVFQVIPSGVGSIQTVASAANATVTPLSGVAGNFASGARVVSAAADTTTLTSVNITATSLVAGTLTLTTQAINSTTGVVTTIGTATITFGTAPILTASRSTVFLSAGENTATADDAGGVTLANTAGVALAAADTSGASLGITINDQNGVALNGQALTVTIAGPGLITLATGAGTATTGTVRAASLTAATQAATNTARVGISADGTSGVATITVASGTTVIATKTVTFYGAVATLTAVQNHRIASSAGAALGVGTAAPTSADIANTPAVVITAKDANGVNVPGLTITALSSDTTVMSNTITVAGVTATPGNYNVAVNSVAKASGSTATLTFRVMSGTTVVAATAPFTYTLGGAVASVALSLDAASYDAGAPAVATLTLKDSSGNAAFDADHTNILAAALASSLSVTKTLFGTTVSSLGGVSTVSFNAPGTSAAAWTISGTTGAGPSVDKAKALSATAAVTNASADAATDAANEATDAANAATDAALAAADAADAATAAAQDAADAVAALSTRVSTLVSDLRKQISALTKLVKRLL